MGKFEVNARENGPYLISGSGILVDADGNEVEIEGKMVALCRCGASQNKPFCDGAHRKENFEAAGVTVRVVEVTE
jgi:3-phenylpropionate/trans-cinnamate dioxygenase ferredoxin subunit